MVRVGISVEGQTEEEFVKDVLAPHLVLYEVYATPIVVTTKVNIEGPNEKGGSININRAKNEITRLIPSFDHVTTLYDFYGFQGRKEGETADELRERLFLSIGECASFTAYLQVHEFEAILFSEPSVVSTMAREEKRAEALEQALRDAVSSCGGTEKINDSPITAPSKRLSTLFEQHVGRDFDKRRDGVRIAKKIGLPTIRRECPLFNNWLSDLEDLGSR